MWGGTPTDGNARRRFRTLSRSPGGMASLVSLSPSALRYTFFDCDGVRVEARIMRHRQFRILVIEDTLSDVKLIQSALDQVGVPHDLMIVSDGEDALAFV